MSPEHRCRARSSVTGGRCALPAGHPGNHSVVPSSAPELSFPERLWLEPGAETPASLEELLEHLTDLIALCREQGFERMADLLNVARVRIQLDARTYARTDLTRSYLPPRE